MKRNKFIGFACQQSPRILAKARAHQITARLELEDAASPIGWAAGAIQSYMHPRVVLYFGAKDDATTKAEAEVAESIRNNSDAT